MAFRNGQNPSPEDDQGHGTFCASIAAGSPVYDANTLGQARGKAQGLAPRAHLAAYKAIYASGGSSEHDVLAAVDRAIGDGVDVLSISLGFKPSEFYKNSISICTFSAMMNGIIPCLAAANGGPKPSSIDNDAPWILTVGASTMDRRIKATVKLGNGMELDGESCYQLENYDSPELDIVYAKDMDCANKSLGNLDVKGKMVVCMGGPQMGDAHKGLAVKTNGGAAMIVLNPQEHGYTTFSDSHVIPASHLSHVDGLKVVSYLKTTKNPKASIVFKGTQFGASPSPSIPWFTSRGPSMYNGGIIKPDIVAPGTNILGAFPVTDNEFLIASGTSMATPHIAGISADLKKNHLDWSPAAIKSAMMTTADVEDLDGNPIADDAFDHQPASYFAMGAGNVNPEKANDPGLVYDIQPDEYISYLCNMYSTYHVRLIVRQKVDCLDYGKISAAELNYPSIAVTMTKSSGATMNITRTLTNVGPAEIYNLQIKAPEGVDIIANTTSFAFSSLNEKKSFQLQFTTTAAASGKQLSEGYLIWSSGKHVVRSPISVTYS
ncbi:hypothetical protein J5N97_010554 [Dioscorea zingiberensis]|uniref:Uncharacterized protein n=1 Tax=Dioscorea zingiberensis TaxID=325984 RepID=A0A9D5D0E9_9LILI|nr:hypothetical protein J5N97_010554 [Dioscorea zingiberensis]